MIRSARPADAEAIAAIWNSVIRSSVATFNSVEKPPEEIARLVRDKRAADLPFLVSGAGQIDGFATYGQFRSGIGYAHTMEHTIHLSAEARGQGRGRALMAELERRAVARGVHSLIGGISGENLGAIRFHKAIGYREIARLPEVGQKFGRWFDLVLMQRILLPGS